MIPGGREDVKDVFLRPASPGQEGPDPLCAGGWGSFSGLLSTPRPCRLHTEMRKAALEESWGALGSRLPRLTLKDWSCCCMSWPLQGASSGALKSLCGKWGDCIREPFLGEYMCGLQM